MRKVGEKVAIPAFVLLGVAAASTLGQRTVPRDPAEPAQGKPQPKILARPAGGIARASVDEKSMRALIGKLVACGTRLASSWRGVMKWRGSF